MVGGLALEEFRGRVLELHNLVALLRGWVYWMIHWECKPKTLTLSLEY
jgi:hypothetical protein